MAISVKRTHEAVVLNLPLTTTPQDIQSILNYFEFVELVGQSQASQADIDELAKTVKHGWFERNKKMFEGHDPEIGKGQST